MRRLVVLALCAALVGCDRSEPRLTKAERAGLQAVGEMRNNGTDFAKAMEEGAKEDAAFNDELDRQISPWKYAETFENAGKVAENAELRVEMTDIRKQLIEGEPHVVAVWSVTNKTTNRKLDHALPLVESPAVQAVDEHGNEYRPYGTLSMDTLPVAEAYDYEPASLLPGATLTDATAFEPPIAAAKEYRIYFRPGFVEDGGLAFRVPVSEIRDATAEDLEVERD